MNVSLVRGWWGGVKVKLKPPFAKKIRLDITLSDYLIQMSCLLFNCFSSSYFKYIENIAYISNSLLPFSNQNTNLV